eukprot:TRINITY_DN40549_c0_g1_i1.p1 TRINITY_DN40549_c0_g1~~TRINITY_DN40549_c0_g1_i1.p1  ORF type:complete len:156 (-),score=44.10 TRINITY_DN40549_c0_g1_i1:199-666(-)
MARPRSSRLLVAAVGATALFSCGPVFLPGSVQQTTSPETGRREMMASLGLLAASGASAAYAAPNWTGKYSDPFHPGCKREISVSGLEVTIDGTDGSPGCAAGETQKPWKLSAKLTSADSEEVLIDFSPKGGPKDLVGKWDGSGIKFPDGNKWSKQ